MFYAFNDSDIPRYLHKTAFLLLFSLYGIGVMHFSIKFPLSRYFVAVVVVICLCVVFTQVHTNMTFANHRNQGKDIHHMKWKTAIDAHIQQKNTATVYVDASFVWSIHNFILLWSVLFKSRCLAILTIRLWCVEWL